MEKKATSPTASLSISMKNLSRPSIRGKPMSPLSSSRALSSSSLGTLCYGNRADIKTYTDVRSNGLTTRVAKYGGPVEERSRKSLSKSPFAVASRKPELKNTPTRSSSLSVGRIAPPERVIFSPKARTNILRSSSTISLPSLSRREDEPLAPTSDIEETPTPSVLDVLQEISRKRINNEELDAERIKKQCKEITDVDGPVKFTSVLKRGNTSPNEGDQKKQRTCRNNEIFSSLSSTQPVAALKRSASESPKGVEMSTKIAHIDKETAQQNRPIVIKETAVELARAAAEPTLVVKVPVTPKLTPKLTLFNRKYDEVALNAVKAIREDQNEISFVKPQEEATLGRESVRKVEQNKLKVLLSCLSGELDEEAEDAVDAKEVSTATPTLPVPSIVIPASKPAVTTTTSSAPTVITSPQAQKSIFTITSTIVSVPNVTDPKPTLSTVAPATFTPIKATPVSAAFSFGAEPVKPVETKSPGIVPTSPGKVTFGDVTKPELNFGGAASKPAATTAPPTFSSTVPSLSGFGSNNPINFGSVAASTTPSTFGSTVTAPVISFGTTPATTAVTFGVNTTTTPAPSFDFGKTTTPTTTTTAGGFSFGNSTANVTTVPPAFGAFNSTTTTSAAPPAFGAVFGNPATTSASGSMFGVTPTTTTSVTSVNAFGAATTTAPTVAAPEPTRPSIFGAPSSNPPNAFGSNTTSSTTEKPSNIFATPQPTSSNSMFGLNNTTDKPSSIFGNSNFGQTSTPSKPSSVFGTSTPEKPTFGSADKSAFSVPEKSQASVFGQQSTQQPPTPAFGASNSTTAQPSVFGSGSTFGADTKTPSIFGNSAPLTNSVFGGATSTFNSPSVTQAFGSSTVTPPVFGSSAAAPPAFGSNASTPGSTFRSSSTTSTGTFGASSSTPSFGGSQTFSTPSTAVFGGGNATPAFNSSFGNNSTSEPSGGFNFKLPGTASNTASPVAEKSVFSRLGTRVETPNATTPSKDLFAFSNSNSTSAFVAPAPSFGNNSFSSPSTFGQTVKTEAPAFNFNATTPIANGGGGGGGSEQPFMFGGAAPAAPSFNFNAGSNNNNNSSSNANNNNNNNTNTSFGFGAASPAAPAFNFNAPAPVGAPTFSVGTGNAAAPPGQRRIRTAVRRR